MLKGNQWCSKTTEIKTESVVWTSIFRLPYGLAWPLSCFWWRFCRTSDPLGNSDYMLCSKLSRGPRWPQEQCETALGGWARPETLQDAPALSHTLWDGVMNGGKWSPSLLWAYIGRGVSMQTSPKAWVDWNKRNAGAVFQKEATVWGLIPASGVPRLTLIQ